MSSWRRFRDIHSTKVDAMQLVQGLSPPSSVRVRLGHWLRLLTDNVLPASLCLVVALVQVQAALAYWQGQGIAQGLDDFAKSWLIVDKATGAAFYLLVTVLFAVRAPRKGPRAGIVGVLVALAGVLVLSLYGLLPTVDPSPERTIPAVILMAGGIVFAIVSLLALGRYFGVFPEARGVAMRGPYAYVRHPLYLAEIVIAVGLVLPILSIWTVALLVAFVGFQYWRAILEERALTATMPGYADYATRTWRIIPWVH
jgi:protein-S-isoprenylcysteine O-methyltransferase Ste14